MAEITPEDRRTALNFASALEFMASGISNDFVRKGARRLIHQIRIRYRLSVAEKKDYIVKLIGDRGGLSAADLVRATGWHRDEIFAMVRELEVEKRVKLERVPPAGDKGGRPYILVFTIEKEGFAPRQRITTR